MGTFELSLKFNSGEDEVNSTKNKLNKKKKQPQFEMTMSNNMLNVRTCADSCAALMKLVQYFASDGDLLPMETTPTGGASSGGIGDPTVDSEREPFNVSLVNLYASIKDKNLD